MKIFRVSTRVNKALPESDVGVVSGHVHVRVQHVLLVHVRRGSTPVKPRCPHCKQNKKATQLKPNRPLANRFGGGAMNMFEQVHVIRAGPV